MSCPLGRVSTPEPPVRRRARSRPRVVSRRRQRDLRDNKPAGQDDVNARLIAETPQGT